MYHLITLGVITQQSTLLLTLFLQSLLRLVGLVFFRLGNLFRLLAGLFLVQLGQLVLASLQLFHDRLQRLAHAILGVSQHFLNQCVVTIEHQSVTVGHLGIKAHTRLELPHGLHASHIFTLGNHRGLVGLAQCRHLYVKLHFLQGRHLRTEHLCQIVTAASFYSRIFAVFLHDEAVYGISVNSCETSLFQLLLQHAHHGRVQLSVHQQDAITLVLGRLDVSILLLHIVGVKVNQVSVLIGLVVLDERLVLFHREMLTLRVLHERKILCPVIEVLL